MSWPRCSFAALKGRGDYWFLCFLVMSVRINDMANARSLQSTEISPQIYTFLLISTTFREKKYMRRMGILFVPIEKRRAVGLPYSRAWYSLEQLQYSAELVKILLVSEKNIKKYNPWHGLMRWWSVVYAFQGVRFWIGNFVLCWSKRRVVCVLKYLNGLDIFLLMLKRARHVFATDVWIMCHCYATIFALLWHNGVLKGIFFDILDNSGAGLLPQNATLGTD